MPARRFRGRDVHRFLEHRLHPVSAFVVGPLFALANAGLDFGGGVLADALSSELIWAVGAGLVLGKLLGISGATLLALRLRIGTLPGCRRSARSSGLAFDRGAELSCWREGVQLAAVDLVDRDDAVPDSDVAAVEVEVAARDP